MVMQHNPAACPSLLMALEEYVDPPVLVILKGPEAEMHRWKLELNEQYLPNVVCLALSPALEDLPASLTRISPQAVNAWVCRGVQCLPPVDSLEGLMRSL